MKLTFIFWAIAFVAWFVAIICEKTRETNIPLYLALLMCVLCIINGIVMLRR